MAVAANPPRPVLTRVHGAATARPLVRTTAGVKLDPRPTLHVVPRGRRAARWVGFAATVLFVLMIAAAAFQTQLASRQLELDRLNKAMDAATQTYNDLRRERAELRSPVRLTTEAVRHDMTPVGDSLFVTVNAERVAEAEIWMGSTTGGVGHAQPDRLDQHEQVKRVLDGQP